MPRDMRLVAWSVVGAASLGACGPTDLQPIQDPSGSTGSSSAAGGGGATGDAGPDAISPPPDGGPAPCKRGIAANAAPSGAFSPTASLPGVSWWYNWSNQGAAPGSGIEFVPM